MPKHPRRSPLLRHAAYRAAVAACSAVGRWLGAASLPPAHQHGMQHLAAEMCCELALGFDAPPESVQRTSCHHRAWTCVRRLEQQVVALAAREPARDVRGVRRALDRADVMIGALPGVMPA